MKPPATRSADANGPARLPVRLPGSSNAWAFIKNPLAPHLRDQQFRYIRSQIKDYAAHGLPVISVDTKSRELIEPFCQPGRKWCQQPTAVLDHDFPSDAKGVAIPYGIYDFCRNEGFVNLGTSRDTSEFAVASIGNWWKMISSVQYPAIPSAVYRFVGDR